LSVSHGCAALSPRRLRRRSSDAPWGRAIEAFRQGVAFGEGMASFKFAILLDNGRDPSRPGQIHRPRCGGRDDALAHAADAAGALASAEQLGNLATAVAGRTNRSGAGIVMERFDVTPHAAFAVLVRVSSAAHSKLAAVADELVGTRVHPEIPPPDLAEVGLPTAARPPCQPSRVDATTMSMTSTPDRRRSGRHPRLRGTWVGTVLAEWVRAAWMSRSPIDPSTASKSRMTAVSGKPATP